MSSHTTYDLSGAVSVVTGGGRDVGMAIARALAADRAAHNPCVYAAGPELTRTEFNRPTWAEKARAGEHLGAVPKDRVAEPEETVGAVPFLSTSASHFIGGQSIHLDGGYLAA